jgi:hypothetical protein
MIMAGWKTGIVFLVFWVSGVVTGPGLKAQLIDYSALPERHLQWQTLGMARWDAPFLKLAYEVLLDKQRMLGFEGGVMTDFGARIYRTQIEERASRGIHIGFVYSAIKPYSAVEYGQKGLRFNYQLRTYRLEAWVQRLAGSYSERFEYSQWNHDFALYYRKTNTYRFAGKFSVTAGVNPGVVIQYVHTNLPDNASIFNGATGRISRPFEIMKDSGWYIHPNIYFELNFGYVIR